MTHLHPDTDGHLTQVASHPLRLAVLEILSTHANLVPAAALAELPGKPIALSVFNYHLWILRGHRLVEPNGAQTDRGYPLRLTRRGRTVLAAVRRLAEEDCS